MHKAHWVLATKAHKMIVRLGLSPGDHGWLTLGKALLLHRRDPRQAPRPCPADSLPSHSAAGPARARARGRGLRRRPRRLLANLRRGRRGAAPRLSGCTPEHLRVLLDNAESLDLLCFAGHLARAEVPATGWALSSARSRLPCATASTCMCTWGRPGLGTPQTKSPPRFWTRCLLTPGPPPGLAIGLSPPTPRASSCWAPPSAAPRSWPASHLRDVERVPAVPACSWPGCSSCSAASPAATSCCAHCPRRTRARSPRPLQCFTRLLGASERPLRPGPGHCLPGPAPPARGGACTSGAGATLRPGDAQRRALGFWADSLSVIGARRPRPRLAARRHRRLGQKSP